MEIDVSIIIVNYNTLQMTADCIDSVIEKTTGLSYEIIVVDNGSTDGSKEYFEQDRRIKYIYSPENLGFGRANNLGYKSSSGKQIFLLNSDTLLINNAVKYLFDFLESSPSTGIVGGQLYNNSLKKVHSYSYFLPSPMLEIDVLLGNCFTKFLDLGNLCRKKYRVAYITGADFMIRRSIIEQIGFFNPEYFMYFEECDLSRRSSDINKKSVFIRSPKIIHLESASFKVKEIKERLYFTSRKTYFRLNSTPVSYFIDNIIYRLLFYSRILLFCFNNVKRSYWTTKLKYFKKFS